MDADDVYHQTVKTLLADSAPSGEDTGSADKRPSRRGSTKTG
jgi:hypothetical protein